MCVDSQIRYPEPQQIACSTDLLMFFITQLSFNRNDIVYSCVKTGIPWLHYCKMDSRS